MRITSIFLLPELVCQVLFDARGHHFVPTAETDAGTAMMLGEGAF
jgi:hypothetical protein